MAHSLRRDRGFALIDALIAFVVLSFGVVALLRLQAQLQLGADVARQRAQAVRLAQAEIERQRSFSVIETSAGVRAFADIVDATTTHDAENTRFAVERRVTPLAGAVALSVESRWTDRRGEPQSLRLDTVIARADPALAGSLGLAAATPATLAPHGRSSHIPVRAKDLGDGRSVFKPVADGATVIVQDHRGGSVLARCTLADATLPTRSLRADLLTNCDATPGVLLRGELRFTAATPPAAAQANDAPLALAMAVALDGSGHPQAPSCHSEARKTVAWTDAEGRHVDAVAGDATPAAVGAASWAELGERFVAYHCVVYPAAGAWSGRSVVVPSGWTIGAGAGERRVCRYAADVDASGAVDGNIEHPWRYRAVAGALAQQNFLVIAGSENCPVAPPVSVRGTAGDVFADLGTAAHQP